MDETVAPETFVARFYFTGAWMREFTITLGGITTLTAYFVSPDNASGCVVADSGEIINLRHVMLVEQVKP